jgi:hypothetical protein
VAAELERAEEWLLLSADAVHERGAGEHDCAGRDFGPVLVAMSFRTPEESVALANNTPFGLAASVWSENINLALDIAPKLKAGVVWINATNLFDAAAGFGGYRESGFGREGGREGMYEYCSSGVGSGKWEGNCNSNCEDARGVGTHNSRLPTRNCSPLIARRSSSLVASRYGRTPGTRASS